MKTSIEHTQKPNPIREEIDNRNRTIGASLLVWEGAYANFFIILTGGAFLTGLALYFGADDFQIGILASIPFFMQSTQLLSPFLFRNPANSKNRILSSLGISRFLWLLVIPLAFMEGSWRLPVLIVIVSLSGLLTMVSSPAWLSWMADIVPEDLRGRFFSGRNAGVAVTTIIGTILGSLILDWSHEYRIESIGYTVIILIAVIGALQASLVMKKIPQNDCMIDLSILPKLSLLEPLRDKPFRRVLIVFVMWNVAIGFSAAFYAPHMLTNLKMSFFQVGLYTCTMALVGVISSRGWGKLIDHFGSKTVLNICAFGIGFIPLIWIFPDKNSLWIFIPEAIFSGLLWTGFNLAAFTLPLDRSPKRNRTAYLSVFAAVTGLAFFGASILAGLMANSFSNWSATWSGLLFVNYHILFIISSFLRLGTAGLITAFHEPSEIRLPAAIQLMGHMALKRMSIGRQLFPITAREIKRSE